MFILGNLFIALAQILSAVLSFLSLLIIVRAIVSWVSPDPYNPVVQFLYKTTDPILTPIRRLMPMMAIDFSPLIALLVIMFLQSFLVTTLADIGYRFKHSRSEYNMSVEISQPKDDQNKMQEAKIFE